MTLRSKLRIEKTVGMLFSVFYTIFGVAEFLTLALTGFRLFTLMFLVILSLASAYSLVRMKKWSVRLVGIRFFLAMTFGATTLYSSISIQPFNPSVIVLLFHLILIVYLAFSLITTIYLSTNRDRFQ